MTVAFVAVIVFLAIFAVAWTVGNSVGCQTTLDPSKPVPKPKQP